jgi:predicted HD phosphohydrolase
MTLASLAHAGVPRKGTAIPYITHPVHVARLLDRHGFSEDVVIAGLLHDVLEDAEFGDKTLQDALGETFLEFEDTEPSEAAFRSATEAFMAARFGENVLVLVRCRRSRATVPSNARGEFARTSNLPTSRG